jgi:hypothetical protein
MRAPAHKLKVPGRLCGFKSQQYVSLAFRRYGTVDIVTKAHMRDDASSTLRHAVRFSHSDVHALEYGSICYDLRSDKHALSPNARYDNIVSHEMTSS